MEAGEGPLATESSLSKEGAKVPIKLEAEGEVLSSPESPLLLKYTREVGGKNRLVLSIGGLRTNTEMGMRKIRKLREEVSSPLRYNTLDMEYSGGDYSMSSAVSTLKQALDLIHKRDGIQEVVLIGSSYGGGLCIELIRNLSQEPIEGLNLAGVFLSVPLIDKSVIKDPRLKLIDVVPQRVAQRAIRLHAAINLGEKVSDELTLQIYNQFRELPETTGSVIFPNETGFPKVKVALSLHDELVDSEKVAEVLKRALPSPEISYLEMDGPSHHKFRDAEDLRKHLSDDLLPFLQDTFRVDRLPTVVVSDEMQRYLEQLENRDAQRLDQLEKILTEMNSPEKVDVAEFIRRITQLGFVKEQSPEVFGFLENLLNEKGYVETTSFKEQVINFLRQQRTLELRQFVYSLGYSIEEIEESKTAEKEEITRAQVETIKSLFETQFPIYLAGGYADEALLNELPPREHHDIDLMVMRNSAEELKMYLQGLGFYVEELLESNSEKPYKYVAKKAGSVELNIDILDRTNDGQKLFIHVVTPEAKRYRMYFDKEILDYPPQKLRDIKVRTLSPSALLRIRSGVLATGFYGVRQQDEVAQQAMMRKFFPNQDLMSGVLKSEVQLLTNAEV